MRIRKLAKDLETDETALMELLRGLGHVRYTDLEQQLPGPIEAQVRRHARNLPKLAAPTPLPVARPRPVAEAEPDLALFERAMATVRPIGPQPKAARPAARAASPFAPAPVAPPPRVQPPEPARGKVPEVGAPRRATIPVSTVPKGAVAPSAPIPADPAAARPPAPIGAASVAAPPIVADKASLERARADAAEQRLADEQARARSLTARVAELEARLAAAAAREADLEALVAAPAATPDPGVPSTLRACFERRGLLGEDEMASALRAILDAHRVAELLRLEVADPEKLDALLWERILLLAEDDPTPPGVVAVRVPSERSEGVSSSANRAAMSRFSTACLVHNVKRIVVVGGSPAYHRTLRDGLDQRLDIRLIPGNRRGRIPAIPSADLVILWASTILDHSVSAQFPEGVVIPHRSVARMLAAATEWIEAG